jgi:hypothetical protein
MVILERLRKDMPSSWIVAKLAYWLMMVSMTIGLYGLVDRARSCRDREINAETAITAITSMGIASLFIWLLFQS